MISIVDYDHCNHLTVAYFSNFHLLICHFTHHTIMQSQTGYVSMIFLQVFKARHSSIYALSARSTSCLRCCSRWHQVSAGRRRRVHRVCPASWLVFHIYFLSTQNNMLSISAGDQFHHIRFRNLQNVSIWVLADGLLTSQSCRDELEWRNIT